MSREKVSLTLSNLLKGKVTGGPKTITEELLTMTDNHGPDLMRIMDILNLPLDKEEFYNYVLLKSFPSSSEFKDIQAKKKYELLLSVYRELTDYDLSLGVKSKANSFVKNHMLGFLTKEEIADLEDDEYVTFVKAFRDDYIYEIMQLSSEVFGYNTLDHVLGVHFIAMSVGRQFKKLGFDVDLGRVSGAAAGHDIGKFGVLKKDGRRVPYLHYYYSDVWFKKHDINYIRNIAINHSTWDLELDNLSLESLILIYSDFRVKNLEGTNPPVMHIYSLKESYEVILNKLDNVDEAKKMRYERVYRKLKDFEDFMESIGMNLDPHSDKPIVFEPIYHDKLALTFGSELVERLKYFSIDHNTGIMYLLRDENSLTELLEDARSVNEWRDLREYVRIFEEYSTYLTAKQKVQTIEFLKENLVHPEDDIRLNSAKVIGELIATYDEDYRKELPQGVAPALSRVTGTTLFKTMIDDLLNPHSQTIDIHRHMLGYSISVLTKSVFESLPANKPLYIAEYSEIFLEHFKYAVEKNSESSLFLLEAAKYIPKDARASTIQELTDCLTWGDRYQRIMTLEVISIYDTDDIIGTKVIDLLNEWADKTTVMDLTVTYQLYKLSDKLMPAKRQALLDILKKGTYRIPEVFLSNLKTATHWVLKRNQLKLLLFYTITEEGISTINTAIHFCNIIKVSAYETVRRNAGNSLLVLVHYLNKFEKNEVAVELLRALEIEGHKFTEYIPYYLGRLILFLEDKEINELIDDLKEKIKTAKSPVKSLLLKTVGTAIAYSSIDPGVKNESSTYLTGGEKQAYISGKWDLKQKFINILLSGMADPDFRVNQTAITTIGRTVFGSDLISIDRKKELFDLMVKKILILTRQSERDDLNFLSDSAAYNYIYKFISDYEMTYGAIIPTNIKKYAFFAGTFDPFTLSHREIARLIRDLGYEVYFSVDEFSWSKKTLPNKVRRSILNMSVAGEENMFLFPESIPVNIGNDSDIETLKKSFGGEITIICGSDVILNATAYESGTKAIRKLPHIVFLRNESEDNIKIIAERLDDFKILDLPDYLKTISSSQIRKNIDENRDISTLIDSLAQEYIYENGFYQRTPIDKYLAQYNALKTESVTEYTPELSNLFTHCKVEIKNVEKLLKDVFTKDSGRALLLKERGTEKVVGISLTHWTRSSDYLNEVGDVTCSEKIRAVTPGRLATIDLSFVFKPDPVRNYSQILITETLADLISRDYEYCLYNNKLDLEDKEIVETLKLFNFSEEIAHDRPVYTVNMTTPVALNLDLENLLKEPFKSAPSIRETFLKARKSLQLALGKLFPGELVISIEPLMLHQGMIDRITKENEVSNIQTFPRKLGAHMCVPYGDILDDHIIPNTVTKALHTEKYFEADLKSFTIKELPFYLSLENQVKILKSFSRDLILVDTILHKGYRMKALDPLLNKEGLKVRKIVAGILSARGRDLMTSKGYSVDTVYYFPRMKVWFNENTLYPFIGGDSLWRGTFPNRNLLPSVNLILPYTMPKFLGAYDKEGVYNLSLTCLTNSLEILKSIEAYYNKVFDRKLTLKNLGQVMTIPRIEDQGPGKIYDLTSSPSVFVESALESLMRIKTIL